MAEILLVATKRVEPLGEGKKEDAWKWVAIDEQPQSKLESHQIARAISQATEAPSQLISIGKTNYGHITMCDRQIAPVMLRSSEVAEALLSLANVDNPGLEIPRQGKFLQLPLCRLSEIGICGPVHRIIAGSRVNPDAGAFTLSEHPGGAVDFPVLWNHNSKRETQLVVLPDKQGKVVTGKSKEAADVWETATRLHFNLDFDFTSQPLAACLTPERALGGRAWPSFILHSKGGDKVEKMDWVYPVLLWANSTLGLMSFYIVGTRNQKGRSNLTISRLPELLVLDPRQLLPGQVAIAKKIFDRMRTKDLMPANMADFDPVRQELDTAVLREILGYGKEVLERLDVLRSQWCDESPLASGRRKKHKKSLVTN